MEQQMSGKDLYLAVMTITSAVATVAAAIGTWLPEPAKGYVVAAGVICSALHAALMTPDVVKVIAKK